MLSHVCEPLPADSQVYLSPLHGLLPSSYYIFHKKTATLHQKIVYPPQLHGIWGSLPFEVLEPFSASWSPKFSPINLLLKSCKKDSLNMLLFHSRIFSLSSSYFTSLSFSYLSLFSYSFFEEKLFFYHIKLSFPLVLLIISSPKFSRILLHYPSTTHHNSTLSLFP